MGKSSAAPAATPPSLSLDKKSGTAKRTHFDGASHQRSDFLMMALNMSWQLALAVFIPVLGGVWLDKTLKTHTILIFVGLGIALLASTYVIWRTMQAANSLPVPKLTEAQKREIQKQYEEEDADA